MQGVSKLRIIYIVALVILAVLIGFAVLRPLATGGKYSEVQKEQLLRTEDEWIIQFDIINRDGRDQNYTINVQIDGELSGGDVLIRDGSKFSYIHHIRRDMLTNGEVSFTIYKEGEAVPFEEVTYQLKK